MSTAAWVCLTIMFFFGAVIAAGTSTELARIDKSRVDPAVYERCEAAHPFRDDLQKACRQGADFQSDEPESEPQTPVKSVQNA